MKSIDFKLEWQIATLDNISHFNIYRSIDGNPFTKIGQVNAGEPLEFLDKNVDSFSPEPPKNIRVSLNDKKIKVAFDHAQDRNRRIYYRVNNESSFGITSDYVESSKIPSEKIDHYIWEIEDLNTQQIIDSGVISADDTLETQETEMYSSRFRYYVAAFDHSGNYSLATSEEIEITEDEEGNLIHLMIIDFDLDSLSWELHPYGESLLINPNGISLAIDGVFEKSTNSIPEDMNLNLGDDGLFVVFECGDESYIAYASEENSWTVYIKDTESSFQRQIFDQPISFINISGDLMIFIHRETNYVYEMNPCVDFFPRLAISEPVLFAQPLLRYDRTHEIIYQTADGKWWILNLSTGELTSLDDIFDQVPEGVPVHEGRVFFYDNEELVYVIVGENETEIVNVRTRERRPFTRHPKNRLRVVWRNGIPVVYGITEGQQCIRYGDSRYEYERFYLGPTYSHYASWPYYRRGRWYWYYNSNRRLVRYYVGRQIPAYSGGVQVGFPSKRYSIGDCYFDRFVIDQTEPEGTRIRYAISFDNQKTWNIYDTSSGQWSSMNLDPEEIIENGMTVDTMRIIRVMPMISSAFSVAIAMDSSVPRVTPYIHKFQVKTNCTFNPVEDTGSEFGWIFNLDNAYKYNLVTADIQFTKDDVRIKKQ